MILDSPFSNLNELAIEIGSTTTYLPSFIIKGGMGIIKKSIQDKIGVDIGLINPKNAAASIFIPGFFIAA